MEEVVRYTYRLRPGATAKASLMTEWGRCRWLWNEAIHQEQIGTKLGYGRLCKMLTAARRQNAWLREGSQVAQQQVLRIYAQALSWSFTVKGCRKPVHKTRRRTLPSLEYTTRGFILEGGRLRLPKGVSIPVVWSRELPSEPTSVRVYQDSLGHWYASFVVRRDIATLPTAEGALGIDWGVKTTATTSDPRYDLPFGGHRKRCAAELARAQRKMARRRRSRGQPRSKGYERAARRAALIQKKAQRQNTHAARVWAQSVVRDHHVIAVEDFKPRFLARSMMARKAADAAIGAAKRELIERGRRAGREVVMVPPAYTTMTCSQCATRAKSRLELGQRTFQCESCGHTEDRDRNAARVILATAECIRAGADDVGHPRGAVRAGNPVIGGH